MIFSTRRSLVVILIFYLNSVWITCVPTKIGAPHLLSPSRKLNTVVNNAYRSNQQSDQESGSRQSRTNFTGELPAKLNDEELHSNGNFTAEDAQITLTNDKQVESNVSNIDSKPLAQQNSPNRESSNRNSEMNPSQYSNGLSSSSLFNNMYGNIAQVDTFNTDNLEYSAQSNDLQCVACSNSLEMFNTNQLRRCCILGYNSCCGGLNQPNQNLPTEQNNQQNSANANGQNNNVSNSKTVNSSQDIQSNNNAPNNPSISINNAIASSSSTLVSNSNPAVNNGPVTSNRNIQKSNPSESYGTKTKSSRPQSTASKTILSNDQQPDEEVRQTIPNYNVSPTGFNTIGFNPNLLNGLYQNYKDKVIYTNGLNNLNYNGYLTGLPPNFHYSNLNGLNLNNLYSAMGANLNGNPNLNNLNSLTSNVGTNVGLNSVSTSAQQLNSPMINALNTNQIGNSHDLFSRKTSNPSSRVGTKTAVPVVNTGNQQNDNSMHQTSPLDQSQYPTKHPQSLINSNENLQLIQTNPLVSNNQQATNPAQQSNTQNQSQRTNIQATGTSQTQQQQGGISNAFSSFISHIPFIGFNPIPITFGFASPGSQQQQINANQPQVAQIITTADGTNLLSSPQNYQYGTVIALRPQRQNAELITPNQLQQITNNNQIQTKANSIQATGNQPQSSGTNQQTGFVSTILNRPYNLYQRLGGYLTRPFGSSKPVLHYANNQFLPLELIPPDLLTEQNLSNLQTMLQNIQYYSQPINANLLNTNALNYETLGQTNPLLLHSYIQNTDKLIKEQQAKSARRSRRLFFF